MAKIKRRDFLRAGLMAGGAVMISRHLSGSVAPIESSSSYLTPSPEEIPDIAVRDRVIARIAQAVAGSEVPGADDDA